MAERYYFSEMDDKSARFFSTLDKVVEPFVERRMSELFSLDPSLRGDHAAVEANARS